MRTGRVLTTHMEIEPRQHEMLGLDLGEGPKRKTLLFGLIAMALWCLALAPILGVPNRLSFSLYFLPPIILTIYGIRPSPRTRRRQTLTDWALGARYALLGHQPIIRLGARRATRQERLPLLTRWGVFTRLGRAVARTTERPPWVAPEQQPVTQQRPAGAPITLRQSSLVIGGDEMHAFVTANAQRRAERAARRRGSARPTLPTGSQTGDQAPTGDNPYLREFTAATPSVPATPSATAPAVPASGPQLERTSVR